MRLKLWGFQLKSIDFFASGCASSLHKLRAHAAIAQNIPHGKWAVMAVGRDEKSGYAMQISVCGSPPSALPGISPTGGEISLGSRPHSLFSA
jgi:hypothetical protein